MKVVQSTYSELRRYPLQLSHTYYIIVLSNAHQRQEYKSADAHRAAKVMPCYDRPYWILAVDEAHSTVTIDKPENPHSFPVFHALEIHPFRENDNDLFPTCALKPPNLRKLVAASRGRPHRPAIRSACTLCPSKSGVSRSTVQRTAQWQAQASAL